MAFQLFESVKPVEKNIKNFKEISYKRFKGDSIYFLEEKGKEIFANLKKLTPNDYNNDLVFVTSKGVFDCEDNGEFGGCLYKITRRVYEPLFSGNFKELIDFDDKLFYIDSCAHMMGRFSYGFIEELDDRYSISEINNFDEEYSIGCQIYNEEVYILTSDHLYKISGGNLDIVETLINLEDTPLEYLSESEVGNILVKDDKLYIGLVKSIAVIDLITKEFKYLKE